MKIFLKEEYQRTNPYKKFNYTSFIEFLEFEGVDNVLHKIIQLSHDRNNNFCHLNHYPSENDIDLLFVFFQNGFTEKTLYERFKVYSHGRFTAGTLKNFIKKLGDNITYCDIAILLDLKDISPQKYLSSAQVKLILDYYEKMRIKTTYSKTETEENNFISTSEDLFIRALNGNREAYNKVQDVLRAIAIINNFGA